MKKIKKIYLPKWQRYFIVPFMIGIWAFTGYMEFFSPEATGEMGLLGFVFMSFILLGAAVMIMAHDQRQTARLYHGRRN